MREILLAPYKNPEWFAFRPIITISNVEYKSASKDSVYFQFFNQELKV